MVGQWVIVPDGQALKVGGGASVLVYMLPIAIPTVVAPTATPNPTGSTPIPAAVMQAAPVQISPESPATVHMIPAP